MKNDKVVIEIEKKKLIQIVIIVIGVLLVCMVSFAISNSNSEKYKDSSTAQTSDDDILKLATKEAGEVSDNEREQAKEISIDEYLELYNGDSKKIILLSKPTCSYCKIAIPILENIIYKYKVEINYLNVGELSSEDSKKLTNSSEYFSEGYGTPLIFIVKSGEIVDKIDGLVTKESYIEFFRQYEFME